MMGLDSLKRAQLNSILEQYYGATVTPEFLFDVNTTFEQLLTAVDVWIEFYVECRSRQTESRSSEHWIWQIHQLPVKCSHSQYINLQKEHFARSFVVKSDGVFVIIICDSMDAFEYTKKFG